MWWENAFLRWQKGKLYLGSRTARQLAEEYGTPLFIYSRQQLLANLKKIRSAFSFQSEFELQVAYAMKANPHQEILKLFQTEGAWVDAVSPGEVQTALLAGFPAEKIIFTGTSISEEDLRAVMSHPGIIINIDAAEQIPIMKKVQATFFPGRKYKVAVRWNPGVGKGFNPKVTTAGARAPDGTPIKFGVEAGKVVAVFEQARRAGFSVVGFHQHLGSGWTAADWPVVKEAVRRMVKKAAELSQFGFNLDFLDFGGGISPSYKEKQKAFPLNKYAHFICEEIKKANLTVKQIVLEPGKFLVADAGVLLVKVVYIKKSYGNHFVCVNAGTYNTVPRPAIYPEAYHEIINCLTRRTARRKVTIAGHLCETGDIFGCDRLMPLPRPGDILAVLHAGAYGHSMASYFNLRQIPPEIII
ncbi:MAG: diaminopimelate decarboxylase [Candidatus Aminicenantales bacterium]